MVRQVASGSHSRTSGGNSSDSVVGSPTTGLRRLPSPKIVASGSIPAQPGLPRSLPRFYGADS